MQFVTPQTFQEAIAKLGSRTIAAAGLDSAQWGRVPVALRERAFFSSRVESVRFLQRAKDSIGDFLSGSRETITRPDGSEATALKMGSRAQFINDMLKFQQAEGIARTDGGLTDTTSEKRLGLIFDVQVRQAQGYGGFVQGMDEDVLDAFPAQRFIRVIDVKEPRDSHTPHENTVMLKTDVGFWSALNEDFGTPYGPWGWGCGHDVEDVSREEAEHLGLISPGERLAPAQVDFNDRAEASVKNLDPELREQLAAEDVFEIDGEAVRLRRRPDLH